MTSPCGIRCGIAGLALLQAFACAGDRGPGPTAAVIETAKLELASSPERLILISVAGLSPAAYRATAGARAPMPTLAALAATGVSADAVQPAVPASRYPAHATLLTGRVPGEHGIVADRLLGEGGVRRSLYSHASQLRSPVLWQVAAEAGLRVTSLGWPTTVGAEIAQTLPDLEPSSGDESWVAGLQGSATPDLLAAAIVEGGTSAAVRRPGPARDAVLVGVACRVLAAPAPPQLLLLSLSGPTGVLARYGPDRPEVEAAFAAVDRQLSRLVGCLRDAGRLETTALVVTGDHGALEVHTAVVPNAVLARAGLLTPEEGRVALVSWAAIARSNGGSAFVYAQGTDDALLARRVLSQAAEETGAFRVVSADEMSQLGADPAAWFGLAAKPGFVFTDDAQGPLLRPAPVRGAWGYLPDAPGMATGFVGWGAGLRRGVRVSEMRQSDVAPTVAELLGLSLAGGKGRALVGVLELPEVSSPSAPP